jgi:hypothetical protein
VKQWVRLCAGRSTLGGGGGTLDGGRRTPGWGEEYSVGEAEVGDAFLFVVGGLDEVAGDVVVAILADLEFLYFNLGSQTREEAPLELLHLVAELGGLQLEVLEGLLLEVVLPELGALVEHVLQVARDVALQQHVPALVEKSLDDLNVAIVQPSEEGHLVESPAAGSHLFEKPGWDPGYFSWVSM